MKQRAKLKVILHQSDVVNLFEEKY